MTFDARTRQVDNQSAPDGDSMESLVRRVRAAVRRSCPPYLAAQAEDIAQEVLIQLLRKLEKTEGKAEFSSIYLLKAAHGATVDEIRRRSRRREQTGREDEMLENESQWPDPEQRTLARSLGREIRRCLETIVPSRRVAVTLHLLGCPVPEVSRRLGCSEKSADNRVYRGMKDLRNCLEAKGLRP
jgi:RNA polymerase sigma-70 factor (ECF subfamily)